MAELTIRCMSFGFKHGAPADADIVLDVRFLDNPFYVPALKEKSGLDSDVQEFVLKDDTAQEFLRRLFAMLDHTLPLYAYKGRQRLTIAFACTGGRHRSVTVAETVAAHLREQGLAVTVCHRDIDKK